MLKAWDWRPNLNPGDDCDVRWVSNWLDSFDRIWVGFWVVISLWSWWGDSCLCGFCGVGWHLGASGTRLWHSLGSKWSSWSCGINFSAGLRFSLALLYSSLSNILISSLMVFTVFIKWLMWPRIAVTVVVTHMCGVTCWTFFYSLMSVWGKGSQIGACVCD